MEMITDSDRNIQCDPPPLVNKGEVLESTERERWGCNPNPGSIHFKILIKYLFQNQ